MRSSSAFEDLDDDDDDTKIVRFTISRSKRPKTVFASSSSSSSKDDFFALQLSENENETKIALGETARWLISAQNANNDNNNRSKLFVETVRVSRGGGTIFGEASRGAHVEMHGGIRGLPVRRTVGGRDYERRRGEYRVRCRGEEARGELFFIQRDESVTREDEDATGVY